MTQHTHLSLEDNRPLCEEALTHICTYIHTHCYVYTGGQKMKWLARCVCVCVRVCAVSSVIERKGMDMPMCV